MTIQGSTRQHRPAVSAGALILGACLALAAGGARAQEPGECIPTTAPGQDLSCSAQRCTILGRSDPGHPEVEVHLYVRHAEDWSLGDPKRPVFVYLHGVTFEAPDPCGGVVNPSSDPFLWFPQLVAAGYAVVTYDMRGHNCYLGVDAPDVPGGNPEEHCGYSYLGGAVEEPAIPGQLTFPEHEDLSLLLNWIAAQPWAALDAPGDPVVGLYSRCMGANVAVSAGAFDQRLDAIVAETTQCDWVSAFEDNGLARAYYQTSLPPAINSLTRLPESIEAELDAWGAGVGDVTVRLENQDLLPDLGNFLWSGSSCRVTRDRTYDHRPQFLDSFLDLGVDLPTLHVVSMNSTLVDLWHQFALLESQPPTRPYKIFSTNEEHVPTTPTVDWGNPACGPDCLYPCGEAEAPLDRRPLAIRTWLDRYLKGLPVDTGPRYELAMDNYDPAIDNEACAYPESLVPLFSFPVGGGGTFELAPEDPYAELLLTTGQELEDLGFERTMAGLAEAAFEVTGPASPWGAVASVFVDNTNDPWRDRHIHQSQTGFRSEYVLAPETLVELGTEGQVSDLVLDGLATELETHEALYLRIYWEREPHYLGFPPETGETLTFSNVRVKLPVERVDVCESANLPALFADDLELALEDPAWDRVVDSLDHLSGVAPGLGGTWNGLQVFVEHDPPESVEREQFVLDTLENGASDYCASFRFDPNGAEIAGRVKIFATRGDDNYRLMRLIVGEDPVSGAYRMRYSAMNDNGQWVHLPWVALPDADSSIALRWTQGDGSGNGSFALYLEGAEVASRTGFNNDNRSLGRQAIGNLGLFRPGTSAMLYWDQFRSFGAGP